jgi:hypothetical protein
MRSIFSRLFCPMSASQNALEHAEREAFLQLTNDMLGRERAKAIQIQATSFHALAAEVVDRRLGRLHEAAHTDDDILSVAAAVRTDEVVPPAGAPGELLECVGQRRRHLVVVPALGDLALHVRILILDHARHQGVGRVHQVHQLVFGATDELFHEFEFGQPSALDGVRREEAVLAVEERRLAGLGGAASDEAQVARLLGIAGEEDAPADVGDAHHVVVPGVNVEALARERPGADVEHRRQALAGDRVKDLLHQDEALARSEVGHPAAGHGEPLAERGR